MGGHKAAKHGIQETYKGWNDGKESEKWGHIVKTCRIGGCDRDYDIYEKAQTT